MPIDKKASNFLIAVRAEVPTAIAALIIAAATAALTLLALGSLALAFLAGGAAFANGWRFTADVLKRATARSVLRRTVKPRQTGCDVSDGG